MCGVCVCEVLEEQQGELQSMLTTAEEHVDALQQTVKETVSWAKSTVEALQWRIKRLSQGDSQKKNNLSLSKKEREVAPTPPPPLASLLSFSAKDAAGKDTEKDTE